MIKLGPNLAQEMGLSETIIILRFNYFLGCNYPPAVTEGTRCPARRLRLAIISIPASDSLYCAHQREMNGSGESRINQRMLGAADIGRISARLSHQSNRASNEPSAKMKLYNYVEGTN